jgi:hypothetical protein
LICKPRLAKDAVGEQDFQVTRWPISEQPGPRHASHSQWHPRFVRAASRRGPPQPEGRALRARRRLAPAWGRFAWNAFAFNHRIDIILGDGATSSLWWATRNEWLGLLDVTGLELEALYGGFARQPLADDSREYVFGARRRLSGDIPDTGRTAGVPSGLHRRRGRLCLRD